jgi:hypothetical protein
MQNYLRQTVLVVGLAIVLYVVGEWYLRLRRSQTHSWDPLSGAPYIVRSEPGRGQGAFAKRDIEVSVYFTLFIIHHFAWKVF